MCACRWLTQKRLKLRRHGGEADGKAHAIFRWSAQHLAIERPRTRDAAIVHELYFKIAEDRNWFFEARLRPFAGQLCQASIVSLSPEMIRLNDLVFEGDLLDH